MTEQLSDCCKAKIKLTGSPNHHDGFACVQCGRIIGTPLPPEPTADWEKSFDEEFELLIIGIHENALDRRREIKSFISKLLTTAREADRERLLKLAAEHGCACELDEVIKAALREGDK